MSSTRGGVGAWLIDLVMKPGTSVQLVPAINVTLCILVMTLLYLVAAGEASVHVYVMGFLAIGLMMSINWFISEFNKVKQQKQEAGDSIADASATVSSERPKVD